MKEGKPSYTAYLVAKAISESKPYAAPMLTEEQLRLARKFKKHYESKAWKAWLVGKVIRGAGTRFVLNKFIIKGLFEHYAARKKFIRDAVTASDVKQVIIVGAGYDTLATELHKQKPDTNFFEIDHPSTQNFKRTALKAENLAKNLHFLRADLAKNPIEEVLNNSVYDKTKPAIFIIEGVLMYLEKEQVVQLLSDISKVSATGSVIVFGVISTLKAEHDAHRTEITDAMLSANHEKFLSAFGDSELTDIMSGLGYKITERRHYHELQSSINPTAEALKSERGEHYYSAVKIS